MIGRVPSAALIARASAWLIGGFVVQFTLAVALGLFAPVADREAEFPPGLARRAIPHVASWAPPEALHPAGSSSRPFAWGAEGYGVRIVEDSIGYVEAAEFERRGERWRPIRPFPYHVIGYSIPSIRGIMAHVECGLPLRSVRGPVELPLPRPGRGLHLLPGPTVLRSDGTQSARAVPLRCAGLATAANSAFYGLAMAGAVGGVTSARRRWRRRRGICPACGYPTHDAPRCPECGATP